MYTTAIIQARIGSTRLPGKVMYPLNGQSVLNHVVTRVSHADNVDDIIIATSTELRDDVIEQCGSAFGADVIRGSESNVLSRFDRAVEEYNPDTIIRVTGDNPLVLPRFIDTCINRFQTTDLDYISEGSNKTFPTGTTCEAFSKESFTRVLTSSNTPEQREHVTPYYKQQPHEFKTDTITSDEIFNEEQLQNRTDLRLTLDEPADYALFRQLYTQIPYETLLDIQDVIEYIDENKLARVNEHVEQRSI